MPIPKPGDSETEDEFISRCMGDDVMVAEYEDSDQRLGICHSQWDEKSLEITPEPSGTVDEVKHMERKTLKFEVKLVDEEQGIIEGYAATFSDKPDSYGDIIDPGAFTKTLKENADQIVSLWNHDTNEPIGMPELRQDKVGLFTRIKLVRGVQRAEEVLLLAKAKVIKRMSIGYETIKQESKDSVRHLKEVRLFDVSPVTFAANVEAMITGVKSETDRVDKIEEEIKLLKDALLKTETVVGAERLTPKVEEDLEAAELEAALAQLNAAADGFDASKAEAAIDEMLAGL